MGDRHMSGPGLRTHCCGVSIAGTPYTVWRRANDRCACACACQRIGLRAADGVEEPLYTTRHGDQSSRHDELKSGFKFSEEFAGFRIIFRKSLIDQSQSSTSLACFGDCHNPEAPAPAHLPTIPRHPHLRTCVRPTSPPRISGQGNVHLC